LRGDNLLFKTQAAWKILLSHSMQAERGLLRHVKL